jgi:hypothetical protein
VLAVATNNNPPRQILSPDTSVSGPMIVTLQSATTKIKELITQAILQGASQEELTKQLNRVIAEACEKIRDPTLKKEIRNGFVVSAKKWYYELNQTIKTVNHNLRNKVLTVVPTTTLYALDINAIFKNGPKQIIDNFRPYMDFNAKGRALIEGYENSVKLGLKAIAADPPISTRLTKDGKPVKVSLRNRVEMAIRYDANLKDVKNLVDNGVKLVWTSSHPNSSPRCAPHQGKLYSLDGTSGTINGIRYKPLADVLKLNGGNSIINGYNCRHRLIEYRSGSHPPTDYTEEEIKREYAIDQRQRNYENTIRNLKAEERLLRQAGFTKEASGLRKKWQYLNKSYEAFSMRNGRPFYRWRTRISEDEVSKKSFSQVKTQSNENPLITKPLTQEKINYEIEKAKKVFENDGTMLNYEGIEVDDFALRHLKKLREFEKNYGDNRQRVIDNYKREIKENTQNLDRAINLPGQNPKRREEKIELYTRKIEEAKIELSEFEKTTIEDEPQFEQYLYVSKMLELTRKNDFKISESPYSDSIYSLPKDEKIDWGKKPEYSYRVADHWNWEQDGKIHCPTETGENYGWALCQVIDGKYRLIMKIKK